MQDQIRACDEYNRRESLRGRPSASACDKPLSAVHGSLMCMMAKGGSALMMARAYSARERERGMAVVMVRSQQYLVVMRNGVP